MKKRRQAKILEIISNNDVETQEELQAILLADGYDVTQATISRDIKELRLVKDLSSKGRYVYSTGKKQMENFTHRAGGIFNETIVNIDYALNTVVIKCFSGMANAACAAIDSMVFLIFLEQSLATIQYLYSAKQRKRLCYLLIS